MDDMTGNLCNQSSNDTSNHASNEPDGDAQVRVQFVFTQKTLDQLDKLKKNCLASSRAEVMRRALTLYLDTFNAQMRGAKFGFVETDGSTTWYRLY